MTVFKDKLIELNSGQKRGIQMLVDVGLLSVALWLALFLSLGERGWVCPQQWQGWLFLLAPVLIIALYWRSWLYRLVLRYLGGREFYFCAKPLTLGFLGFVLWVWLGR